eukprot:6198089-Pleurochrysis_carterae.AAC.2
MFAICMASSAVRRDIGLLAHLSVQCSQVPGQLHSAELQPSRKGRHLATGAQRHSHSRMRALTPSHTSTHSLAYEHSFSRFRALTLSHTSTHTLACEHSHS